MQLVVQTYQHLKHPYLCICYCAFLSASITTYKSNQSKSMQYYTKKSYYTKKIQILK
jgi:hypothetical protein